jgi:hypothetical protein
MELVNPASPQAAWSTKHIQRLIVLSSTYRQVSFNPKSEIRNPKSVDPDNRLLWRMNRQRLESEVLRDNMLAVAGNWNRQMFGPMVRIQLEREVYDLIFTEGEPDGLWKATPDVHAHARRTIYLFVKRNVRLPMLEAFDQPDTLNSCALRPVSTFAPQALILMNGPLAQAQSKIFAARLLREAGNDRDRIIARAFMLAFGRPARDFERDWAREYLERQTALLRERVAAHQPVATVPGVPSGVDPAFAAALADFCLALFNANEFLYVA